MQTASLTQSNLTNTTPAQLCGDLRTNARSKVMTGANDCADAVVRMSVRLTSAVMQILQRSIKVKVAQQVADRAHVGKRTVEHWQAGDRQIEMDDFFFLLEGAEGVEFLDIFWDCVPKHTRDRWLKKELLAMRLAEAELEVKRVRQASVEDQLRMELGSR